MIRRTPPSPFGLSFLDLLCCAFGAMVLLMVLTEQRSAAIIEDERARLEQAQVELDQKRGERIASEARAEDMRERRAGLDTSSAGVGLDRLELLPRFTGKRVIVAVDGSGSMKSFTRGGEPQKWPAVVRLIDQLLTSNANLEAYAIVLMTDGREGRKHLTPIFPPSGGFASIAGSSDWPESVGNGLRALRGATPVGGVSHYRALEALLRDYVTGSAVPADTVVIVTDGLPNHGPTSDGDSDPREDTAPRAGGGAPSDGWVSPDSKRRRAQRVVELARGQIERLSPTRRENFRLHVVCMEWPDDRELISFALQLAGAGRGMVLYVSEPEEDVR